ncbi:MAG: class I SAM-dependent methyltransferase [Alphaproteobacteria bacterium]|nr:class I SAM-dependent methyltransferase [Alphaproteobacteria bacterium]
MTAVAAHRSIGVGGEEAANYGIDAPVWIRRLVVAGVIAIATGAASAGYWATASSSSLALQGGSVAAIRGGLGLLWSAAVLWRYGRHREFLHRERMLNAVVWRGTETVLDIGVGSGLLLIGAAKRVPQGYALRIDVWRSQDPSHNTPTITLHNALLEGVAANLMLLTGDARRLPFASESVDVVLSNLCLHNISNAAGRSAACREIARVLAPDGLAFVSDHRHSETYMREMLAADLTVFGSPLLPFTLFPPLRVVSATKTAGSQTP